MTTKTNSKTRTKKLTRKELHNEKRAERFDAAGVTVENISGASASCEGKDEDGETQCCLCDHGIKWLFRLTLTLTGGEPVTFRHVGSQCITDWAEALPVSEAQRAVLTAIQGAQKDKSRMMAEARKLAAQMRRRNAAIKYLSENGDSDGAKLMERYFGASEAVQADATLADIASRTIRFQRFASDRQRSFFAGALGRAERAEQAPVVTVTPKAAAEPVAAPAAPEGDLVSRAQALLATGVQERMRGNRGSIMADIASKGARWGLSSAQERFLLDLVKEAEGISTAASDAPNAPQVTVTPRTFDPAQAYVTPF